MQLGNLKLKNNFLLAPMHGVNCLAFRMLCKHYGAGLVATPMVHARWVVKEKKLPILVSQEERPLQIQLIGDDEKIIKNATKIIEPYADIIDLNFGCPSKDILALNAGGYFTKNLTKLGKMVNAVVSATNKPVTAKIRAGWDDKNVNALEAGKVIEDNGASAVTLHARTVKQGYSGKADWGLIKSLKSSLSIPVVGNGDVWGWEDALKMVEQTKVDAVMVGRAAMCSPFVFKECLDEKFIPTKEDRVNCIKLFVEYYEKYETKHATAELKQHIMWMVKGLDNATKHRLKLSKMKNYEEVKKYAYSL
ncbi:tRNA-dihydrouridine synthase [Candidatus Woesearchaeota archaeon]|nr:MAG: tRNA-dihydrouridine synthase [Candidatus Woesearchaeota archaeon]